MLRLHALCGRGVFKIVFGSFLSALLFAGGGDGANPQKKTLRDKVMAGVHLFAAFPRKNTQQLIQKIDKVFVQLFFPLKQQAKTPGVFPGLFGQAPDWTVSADIRYFPVLMLLTSFDWVNSKNNVR